MSSESGSVVALDEVIGLADFNQQRIRLNSHASIMIWTWRMQAGSAPSSLVLSAMLKDKEYARVVMSYHAHPFPGFHGPFLLSELDASSFEPVNLDMTPRRIAACLNDDIRYHEPLTSAQQQRLAEAVEFLVPAGSSAFELKLGQNFASKAHQQTQDYSHEWSHAVVAFREFVIISPNSNQLRCIMLVHE